MDDEDMALALLGQTLLCLPRRLRQALKIKVLYRISSPKSDVFLLFFTANSSDLHGQLRTSTGAKRASRGIYFPGIGEISA
jgi:hypothetical protein